MRKIKITKKIWNYLAVLALSVGLFGLAIFTLEASDYLSSYEASYTFLGIIGISIIWIFIGPIFLGELAKEKRMKAKSWFKFAIIAILITIIVAAIGLVAIKYYGAYGCSGLKNDDNTWSVVCYDGQGNVISEEEYNKFRNRRVISATAVGICALLPVLTFLSFYFYLFLLFTQRRFSRLDFSHEPVVAIDAHEAEQIDSSQIPDVCPHCKNPNTKKLQDCEWCGNKTC